MVGGVQDLSIIDNMIGTNITRRNYRNGNGIVLDGIHDSLNDTYQISGLNEIKGNMIAYSRYGSGISVEGANGVEISDNVITLNGVGVSVGNNDGIAAVADKSTNVELYANEITRSSGNGIYIGDSSNLVTVGSDNPGDGNRIGTNASGRRGLGNRANGVHVEAAGSGVTIEGNSIIGNGARRNSDGRNGIRIEEQLLNVDVSENDISMNRGHGIVLDAAVADTAVAATITKNVIFRNYGSGVSLTNTDFASLVVGSLDPSTGSLMTDEGNIITSNRRYGIDARSGEAKIGGNRMLGNRRGGIDSILAAPVITSATLSGTTLTVGITDSTGAAIADTDLIHVYIGTGAFKSIPGFDLSR